MKNIVLTLMSLILIIGAGCETEDNLVFQLAEETEEVSFTNDLLAEYVISESFASNVAERLTWEAANFGAPVNVSYELSAGLAADMSDGAVISTTNKTNVAVTVEQLLGFAEDLGLDSDPATTTEDGQPNNTGVVYFQLHAYAGTANDEDATITSEIIALNITVLEVQEDGTCEGFYIVGDGAPDAGWAFATAIQMNCENDVQTVQLRLANDIFRFFTEDGNWDSGLNYTYFADEGYTIDENFELNADDADNNFLFVGTPGIYNLTVDNVNKTITLEEAGNYFLVGDGTQAGWDWTAPVVLELIDPYVYQGSVELNPSGAFRVFTTEGDWDSGRNYPFYEDAGFTIDAELINAEDGDSNFTWSGAAGTYTLTVNEADLTITVE